MKTRLLLCEPDRSTADELRDHFTHRGFDVQLASNGLECLDRVREARPDIAVLNWEMPWGGGDGVLSVLHDEYCSFPVVLSTQNPSPAFQHVRYRGVVEPAVRPLRAKDVFGAVLNALRKSEGVLESELAVL